MTLVDTIFQIIKGTGTNFAADLWQSSDLDHLRYVSGKLVALEERIKLATTSEEKDECRAKVNQLLDNLRALALSRVNIAEAQIRKQIEDAFVSELLAAISPHLALLVAIVRAVGNQCA